MLLEIHDSIFKDEWYHTSHNKHFLWFGVEMRFWSARPNPSRPLLPNPSRPSCQKCSVSAMGEIAWAGICPGYLGSGILEDPGSCIFIFWLNHQNLGSCRNNIIMDLTDVAQQSCYCTLKSFYIRWNFVLGSRNACASQTWAIVKNFNHTLIQRFCLDLKTISNCWLLHTIITSGARSA